MRTDSQLQSGHFGVRQHASKGPGSSEGRRGGLHAAGSAISRAVHHVDGMDGSAMASYIAER